MAINFSFSSEDNNHYATSINGGSKFFIGRRVPYKDNVGLMNLNTTAGLIYDPNNYEGTYGFWANFISPTAQCESKGSYYCLNTYDQARFTFGFMQYAAHVPGGDFVNLFRRLLKSNLATEYFPSLELHNNRIHYRNEQTNTLTQLENDSSTEGLMSYLNPTLTEIEQQEIICSARMVHWAMNDPQNVSLQISTAIEQFKANMVSYSKRYNLDNFPDKVCLLVSDIRHQGRASSNDIISALNTKKDYEKAYKNLLSIGEDMHPSRVQTLRKTIDELVKQEKLGKKIYNQSKGDFD